MNLPIGFIAAGTEYNTAEKYIPLPLLRRAFTVKDGLVSALLTIGSLGYYEAHINGKNITKGEMAPYRSAPTSIQYFDRYDVTDCIMQDKNVLAVILGNGLQNSIEPTWNFNELPWRSAPALSFELVLTYTNGEERIVSDENVKCCDSPIIFNDFHYGEYYDARLEQDGWDMPDFDDSGWKNAIKVTAPEAERRIPEAEPIKRQYEIKPADILPYEDGYIYDFGVNTAGLTRLTIKGVRGQKIVTRHFEVLKEGNIPYLNNLRFAKDRRFQEDEYICRGNGIETHVPRFTYHGFRYVWVTGVTKEQATKSLLTAVVINSDIKQAGRFECDNDTVNRIQECTVRSDITNFHYFPTDCPHREKNGWTADAALSAEQMLLNLTPANSYREWMRNIYKAMDSRGALPGIIPTGGWGFDWGNGPAWDSVLVHLPYFTYKYTGDKVILSELARPLMKYIIYLQSRLDEKGLIAIGLGDWCEPGRSSGSPRTPLVVTDSITVADILQKASFIYGVLGLTEQKEYVDEFEKNIVRSIRENLIDLDRTCVKCNTQTGQAMAIFYNIFNEDERERAVERLVRLVKDDENHMVTGVLGGRVILRVLADNGEQELALKMITRPDFPSYGNWIKQGATTLWESFRPDHSEHISSRNHHFWGDVSAWFYIYVGGLRVNPTGRDVDNVDIHPLCFENIGSAKVSYSLPSGSITAEWEKTKDGITLSVTKPAAVHGKIIYGEKTLPLENGVYEL